MSWTQVSSCPHCGAPIYAPMFYQSVTPPPNTYTCTCSGQTTRSYTMSTTGTGTEINTVPVDWVTSDN